jgi:hypothetical protein
MQNVLKWKKNKKSGRAQNVMDWSNFFFTPSQRIKFDIRKLE